MSILSVHSLEKSYGVVRVLTGVDLAVETGQKLALVGQNGCGKTTLLHIVAGLEEADHGEVVVARSARAGLLIQESVFDNYARSLWAEMEAVFTNLTALEQELDEIGTAVATGSTNGTAMMARYARLQEEFERCGGYTLRSRIERVLRGLGFGEEDWDKPLGVLSGGERTRAALSRLLLRQPNLLLLDEPTNHLDMQAVAWLERFLSTYAGAVLVVSHDRYFLDRVVEGIYELIDGVVRFYRGNYSSYRQVRTEEHRILERVEKQQARAIAHKERLIREAPADERSKRQARSIAKSLVRTERIDPLPVDRPSLRMRLASGGSGSRIALSVRGLRKSYTGCTVIADASFSLEAGEKVGVIGANGTGKTTLLRLLAGLEKPDSGDIQIGYHHRVGSLAQDEEYETDTTVFAAAQEAGSGDNFNTRSYLARFLFHGDEVWKSVSSLSGGERRRLSLARLILSDANLLLLDEPTNHLDLASIEALEDALRAFAGTMLVVSHDRYFLGRVTGRLLALIGGRVLPFTGYEQFASWHVEEENRQARQRTAGAAARRLVLEREREARRTPLRAERCRARTTASLEAALTAKEEERARMLREMAHPDAACDFVILRDLSTKLAAIEREISGLYKEWGTVISES